MLNLLALNSINNVYFRIVNFQFENCTRTLSFVNCFFFRISGNLLFSKTCYHFQQIHKIKNIHLRRTNEATRKSMDKDSYSDMSFSISADSRDYTEADGSDTPGFNLESLRKFEVIIDNEFTTQGNDHGVKLKVMNYNVLAPSLLELHHYLYRAQKPYMLNWNFRKDLLLQEIITVNPDILCLQEVQESEIPHFFKKLETFGYKSVNKMKTRYKGDGLSLYYRSADIKLLESNSVEFRQPGIVELESRDNVGLIVRLEKDGKEFIVATTHLLYNPKRTEVRLAQVQMLLAELHRMARKDEEEPMNVLLMGDFNSPPDSPLIDFIVNGKILSQYQPLPPCLGISAQSIHMQQESKLFHSEKQNISPAEGRDESITPRIGSSVLMESHMISHPFNFSSVYNLNESPRRGATTFQNEWVMVDYIFYTSGFELVSRLSLPTPADCEEYIRYLPNNVNPSDHLPLVAEFEIY